MQQNIQKKESSREVLKIVKEVKDELSAYRAPLEKNWIEYENFYYGKHHKTGEDKKTVKNHVFKIIEGEVPILTDTVHGTSVLATSEDRQDDALILEKSIRYVYNDQNLQLLLPSLVRSSLISSAGILHPYYDPDANMGEGKIKLKKLSWENVWLDGNASTIEDATRARIEIPMRVDEVVRIFPHKKDEIEDIGDDKTYAQDSSKDNGETRDVSGDIVASGRPKKYKAKDIINYVETWIKSYDLEQIPQEETFAQLSEESQQLLNGIAPDIFKWEDHPSHIQSHLQIKAQLLAQLGLPPETSFEQVSQFVDQMMAQNPEANLLPILLAIKVTENHIEEHNELIKLNPTGERPKYKDGWRVIKTVKDVVLYDGENPEQNGELPLVLFYCYKDDTIYGFSEVKNIIDAQKSFNLMDWKEYRSLKRNSNSGWIADHESGVTDDQLTDEEGIVIQKAKGTEVRRIEAGVTSPQLDARKVSDKLSMEDISGVNEATQGRTPSPNASGAAITALQNQAIGRIRLKDRLIQYSMKRLGKLVASLIINNWSTEKKLRLNSDTSGSEELIFDPIKMSDLDYSVEIAAGTMAGVDKDSLNSLYLNLLTQKVITPKQFFLVADLPRKEIIMKSMEDEAAMQLEQVQQESQAQLEQVNTIVTDLQKENMKLKAMINPDLLSNEERKALDEILRVEALEKIKGNSEAINGQSQNQGMI